MSGLESILGHPAVVGTAWVLLHFLWQGAAISLGLALLLLVIPRRNAVARFWAAAGAMGLLFLAPVITALTFVYESLGPAADRAGALGSLGGAPFGAAGGAGGAGHLGGAGAGLPAAIPFVSSAMSHVHPSEPWLAALVFFWMAGVVVLSIRNLNGFAEVRFFSRMGTTAPPLEWVAVVDRLCSRLGVKHTVRLVGSTLVRVPTVIGWLRPVILVPVSAFTGLEPRHLEAILAHELAHVRRHDYLLNLIQTAVETLLFYHPAVWWVSRKIREEREHCCDDVAAASCGDAVLVARALAEMEALRGVALGFAVRADGGSLLSRVARLLGTSSGGRRSGDRWLPTTFVAVTAAGLCLLAAGALRSASDAALAERGDPTPQVDVGRITLSDEASVNERAALLELAETAKAAPGAPTPEPAEIPAEAAARRAHERDAAAPVAPVVPGTPAPDPVYDTPPMLADASDYGDADGAWSVTYKEGHLTLRAEYGHSDWVWGSSLRDFGVTEHEVDLVLGKDDIDIDIPKDAGTFHITGKVTSRGKKTTASGVFTFEPDPEYVAALQDEGYSRSEITRLQMELAGHDVSRRYIQEVADLGYERLPLSQLLEFKVQGVTTDYIRQMHEAYPDVDADRLVEFRVQGVTPEYVKGLREAGYSGLDEDKIVEFRVQGVTPEYVKGLMDAGYPDLDSDEIVEFRVQGVTPEYARALKEAGVPGLDADRIVEFKVQGVSPDYVRGMAESGYSHLDPDHLVEFRVQGVSPEYARGMAEAGYADLDPDHLVEFRVQGVDPEYARAMKAFDIPGLTADKLIEMRVQGVTPELVSDLRKHGFDDLTADEIIEITVQGMDRYLKRRD